MSPSIEGRGNLRVPYHRDRHVALPEKGLYLFTLSAYLAYWWVVIGPVCITLLFVFVSIPLMDRHVLKTKPAYAQTMKKFSAIIPWLLKK